MCKKIFLGGKFSFLKKKMCFFREKNLLKKIFLYISSSYAKILGETNFRTREIPRSGSKAKDGEKKRKKRRANDGNNNGQLRNATPPRVAQAKPPGPEFCLQLLAACEYTKIRTGHNFCPHYYNKTTTQ